MNEFCKYEFPHSDLACGRYARKDGYCLHHHPDELAAAKKERARYARIQMAQQAYDEACMSLGKAIIEGHAYSTTHARRKYLALQRVIKKEKG